MLNQCVRVHALEGLALCASHSGEIALVGSRHLRATLVAAPVLFAHAAVTVVENGGAHMAPVFRMFKRMHALNGLACRSS